MDIINVQKTNQAHIIKVATKTLSAGGLLVYPTETVYGLGVDATNSEAVSKLLAYKSQRGNKPFSIAVCDKAMAENYVKLNNQAENLYENFLPGPITVISRSLGKVAPAVESARGTLGVRIPAYPLVRTIIKTFGRPITATSANASYQKRPLNVSDILDNISPKQKELISLVLDAGQLPPRESSTVVDTTLDSPTILRQGEIKLSGTESVTSHNETETRGLASNLVNQYRQYLNERALIFALVGELGAGKTQFAKGIALSLGIKQPITSPTFTLAKEYDFTAGDKKNEFIHLDTWRLFDDKEFTGLGFAKMVDNLSVVAIEWADKVADFLKQHSSEAKIVWVKIEPGEKENERVISYSDEKIR